MWKLRLSTIHVEELSLGFSGEGGGAISWDGVFLWTPGGHGISPNTYVISLPSDNYQVIISQYDTGYSYMWKFGTSTSVSNLTKKLKRGMNKIQPTQYMLKNFSANL